MEAKFDETGQPVSLSGTAQDITERKEAERALRESHDRLRKLTGRLQAVRENERTHIAREIHDELGQRLTAIKIDLSWSLSLIQDSDEDLLRRIRSALRLVEETVDTVREISRDLRPPVLDQLGLEAAIDWQVEEFGNRTGCKTKLTVQAENVRFDEHRDITVFRILQEALTNTARHAAADSIQVSLGASENELVLEVCDNGRGISDQAIDSNDSIGLIGMRERAGSLGGKIEINRRAEGGTALILRVPLVDGNGE